MYGPQPVLRDASWEIPAGTVMGLVGPNGAGKSTLLNIVRGTETADEGSVYRQPGTTIGYLPQEPRFDDDATPLSEVMAADKALAELESRMAQLERSMGEPAVYEDAEKLADVMEQHARTLAEFEDRGGPNLKGRAESTLRALGIPDHLFHIPMSALSGGQKKQVGMSKILVTGPDVLLLDEPDNHLDMPGKVAMERMITSFEGTVVIISHDRHLLDVVAEMIVEVGHLGQIGGGPQITVYHGNYSEYAFEKASAEARTAQAFDIQQREIQRLEQSMHRLMAWSRNGANEKFVKRAKNIQRRIDSIDRIERPRQQKQIGLRLQSERGSNKVIDLQSVSKSFEGPPVLSDVNTVIWSGERVGLVGENGSGKSVLFRLLRGEEQPTSGDVRLGPSVSVGYYAQEHETLDLDRNAVEEIRRAKPMHEGDAFAFLGRFQIGHELASKPMNTLSGGEKARVQLAKLMLGQGNLLLLDEPTNNLDILSAEALEDALAAYEGTVFVISHDRYFLDRVVTRVVEVADASLIEHPGGMDQYMEKSAIGAPA